MLKFLSILFSFIAFTAMNIAWWVFDAVEIGWVFCILAVVIDFIPTIVDVAKPLKGKR